MSLPILTYKREEKNRDFSYFLIVCENDGKISAYFNNFISRERRIAIHYLNNKIAELNTDRIDELINRYDSFLSKIDADVYDNVWFVIDTDKWGNDGIRKLVDFVEERDVSKPALSNPCFEVWLYNHFKSSIQAGFNSCYQIQNELSLIADNFLNQAITITHLKEAIQISRLDDLEAESEIPGINTTKVYKLGDALIKRLEIYIP